MRKTTMQSFRSDPCFDEIINILSSKYKMNKSEIIKLGVSKFFEELSESPNYEGIDLKKYANIMKLEFLRKCDRNVGRHYTARLLFMNRVKREVWKLSSQNVTRTDIINHLQNYMKEAQHFDSNFEILSDLNHYIEVAKKSMVEFKEVIKKEVELDE